MALTFDAMLATPDHYLHSFDGDEAVFVPMNRDAYHRSIFLDHRIQPATDGATRIPVSALWRFSEGLAPNWIFHMAHGGSTLLARAIDRIDANLILREPFALRQLALAPSRERLSVTSALLGRRYATDLPTIVKANVPVNFLLSDLVASGHTGQALILYNGLEAYLLAILRSSDHRRWVRAIVGLLSVHICDPDGLSDATCAAALWSAQMREFAGAVARSPGVRTLDAETFFTAPQQALTAVAAHLKVPMADGVIQSLVTGPLFTTYSKNPDIAFDNAARISRQAELAQHLAGELAEASAWIDLRRDEAARAFAAVKSADILLRA